MYLFAGKAHYVPIGMAEMLGQEIVARKEVASSARFGSIPVLRPLLVPSPNGGEILQPRQERSEGLGSGCRTRTGSQAPKRAEQLGAVPSHDLRPHDR